ncbi:MAG: helix-turn-helix domain-containing protein [Acidiferrobacterales bacterium]|nr:helix-turn-helix domain-containing protein [Acidiferrobacterales bacterium]
MKPKHPELVKLGEAIRRVRESQGFSQDKFAFEVGLGRSYYGSLERGEINVSMLTLLKITKALNVEPKDVFPLTLNDE